MKRQSSIILPLAALALCLTVGSCSGGGDNAGTLRGVVTEMDDSTKMMTVEYDGSTTELYYGDALLTNGAVMAGDSVSAEYRGSGRRGVATRLELIPRQGNVVDLEELRKSDEPVLTKPASEEDAAGLEKFREATKKAARVK